MYVHAKLFYYLLFFDTGSEYRLCQLALRLMTRFPIEDPEVILKKRATGYFFVGQLEPSSTIALW